MSDILERILARKKEEVAQQKKRVTEQTLLQRIQLQGSPRGFAQRLKDVADQGTPAVIAEIKRASPSKGLIRADFDAPWIAAEYESNGAACLSILTDQDFFQGSEADFVAARSAVSIPAIRKDFMIDEFQILESRAMGADCILLIAAALEVAELAQLYRTTRSLGMDALLEVHDFAELDMVLNAGLGDGLLIGVNNRNLRTFETRLETTLDLLPWVPAAHCVVTESGLNSHNDVQTMLDGGVLRFLIGESLMRQPNPGVALRRMIKKL